MKLSTRARYGLRICFLIGAADGEIVSLTTLVKKTNLSQKYLEQILTMLKKGNILMSVRGTLGGYHLARNADDITINQILTALDDDFKITECSTGVCTEVGCPNKIIFYRLYHEITKILEGTTLHDMIIDYYNEKEQL